MFRARSSSLDRHLEKKDSHEALSPKGSDAQIVWMTQVNGFWKWAPQIDGRTEGPVPGPEFFLRLCRFCFHLCHLKTVRCATSRQLDSDSMPANGRLNQKKNGALGESGEPRFFLLG